MRVCPTVEGSSVPLILHRIGAGDCLSRQACNYHKCHRCIYRGKAATWEPAETAAPTEQVTTGARGVPTKGGVTKDGVTKDGVTKTGPKAPTKPAAPAAPAKVMPKTAPGKTVELPAAKPTGKPGAPAKKTGRPNSAPSPA